MVWEDRGIGVIFVGRDFAGAFSAQDIALLKTFADQAVIAIQNVRLWNETQEALARQTATADILRVISSSPANVQPVFDAIVETAVANLRCDGAAVMLREANTFSVVAAFNARGIANPLPKGRPIDAGANLISRVILSKQILHLPDWSAIDLPTEEKNQPQLAWIKASLMLPLMRATNASACWPWPVRPPGHSTTRRSRRRARSPTRR